MRPSGMTGFEPLARPQTGMEADQHERLATMLSLVQRTRPFVLARIADGHAVDEILSEVRLVVWRRLDEIPDEEARAVGWLRGVAQNVVLNHVRSKTRRRRLQHRVSGHIRSEAHGAGHAGQAAALHRVVAMDTFASLREEDQQLVTWIWEGRSQREMAEALGIRLGALRMRILRLRDRLRDGLE